MKITISMEGRKPVEVDLAKIDARDIKDALKTMGGAAKPATPARPAPKYKKGDWFWGGKDAPESFMRLDGDAEWHNASWRYDACRIDKSRSFRIAEADIAGWDWTPIPPRPVAPKGKKLTGRIIDAHKSGGKTQWMSLGGQAVDKSPWSAAVEHPQCGFLRWEVEDDTASDIGTWWLCPVTGLILECVGRKAATWDMRLDNPRYRPFGTIARCTSGPVGYDPIPPKPTNIPSGKKLTGEIVDITAIGPEVKWMSDTGKSVFQGGPENHNPRFGPRRWEVEDVPAAPKGFVVWEPGIKDDGRVMVRLAPMAISDVKVVAVDQHGIRCRRGDLLFLREEGVRLAADIHPGIAIAREGRDSIKFNK